MRKKIRRLLRQVFNPKSDERYEISDDDEVKGKEKVHTYGSERRKRAKRKEPLGSAWGVYE